MPTITINGHDHTVPDGQTLLHALRHAGIDVPTLCHDDRLKPIGGCRLCLVRVAGCDNPVAACNTPVVERMVVDTHTPEIDDARHAPFVDRTHPHLRVDMQRCVLCYRCVHICAEVQGQFVWHALGRGDRTYIVPGNATSLLQSDCTSCGACADTCPSGAIEDRFIEDAPPAQAWTRTVCPYCGTGCELEIGTRDNRVVATRAVLEAPVNRGHLCVKGRYAFDFNASPDRLTSPLIRADGAWRAVSWADATGFIADKLKQLRHKHGQRI